MKQTENEEMGLEKWLLFLPRMEFSSQHLHQMASQLSVTPVPGFLMPSSGLFGHWVHISCTYIHAPKTLINIKYILLRTEESFCGGLCIRYLDYGAATAVNLCHNTKLYTLCDGFQCQL